MGYLNYKDFFFIGIAGSGMSALAQFLRFMGKNVSGSDRLFNKYKEHYIKKKLNELGIKTFEQGKGKILKKQVVIVSTAIEKKVYEYRQAKEKGVPIIHRADLLSEIAANFNSIGVAGTSGKSTTTAMIFHILNEAGLSPSVILGSSIISLKEKGYIGNAYLGKSNILVFEADESDGTITKYKPQISLVLNISKDHKEPAEIKRLFESFFENTKWKKIKNADDIQLSDIQTDIEFGFSERATFRITDFLQKNLEIHFKINEVPFKLNTIGKHNAENACAAVSAVSLFNVSLQRQSRALEKFKGISRRMQFVGETNNIMVFDDFAHNPQKLSAAIAAVKPLGKRTIMFFQPHGFGPLKFMFDDLVQSFSGMRKDDLLFIADVFYPGGTVKREVTSETLINVLKTKGLQIYGGTKEDFLNLVANQAVKGDVILITGGRDVTLDTYAQEVFNIVKNRN